MKLSDAIRLGSMLTPQGIGGWMDGSTRCALAAASDAAGVLPIDRIDACNGAARLSVNYHYLAKMFPVLHREVVHPARVDNCVAHLTDVIWSLNDCWGWTREDIATWVEAIERKALDEQDAVRNALLDHMQVELDRSFGLESGEV